ncbi:MAG: protein jag [Spirochaetaceae bacterium]|jgi:spoIIIJ-associated protein|nr:protein jag [Spirochaetaceae bacterium]
MTYEFDGHTEKEAVDKAIKELGLEQDCFDVEILESQKGGLFRKGYVKIRIHIDDGGIDPVNGEAKQRHGGRQTGGRRNYRDSSRSELTYQKPSAPLPPENEFEEDLLAFITQTVHLMGHTDASSAILYRESRKLVAGIEASDTPVLIGRKGHTLDSLQLIVNNYAAKQGRPNLRIILDCQGYRLRREDSLVRMALRAADRVRRTRQSLLLEPMNPFDRRIIHTAIGDMDDVGTESEGNGAIKQVRVFFRGGGKRR